MISLDVFVGRLCRVGSDAGPRSFPCRAQDHDILMKSLCMLMDSSRPYSEEEINELLQE